jgi:hypothetical protein
MHTCSVIVTLRLTICSYIVRCCFTTVVAIKEVSAAMQDIIYFA